MIKAILIVLPILPLLLISAVFMTIGGFSQKITEKYMIYYKIK